MANKVTGSTDATGALNASSTGDKSVVIVGVATGTPTKTMTANKMFSIGGTADAKAVFGDESPIVKMVKVLIANGVGYINGVLVDSEIVESGTIADNYTAALNSTLDDKSIKCVLLDTNAKAVTTALKTHLALAEGEDMLRYAVVAPSPTVDSQADLISFAQDIDDSRIFIPGPSFIDDEGNATPAVCVMAGLTGIIMSQTEDPALPVNGVAVIGIGKVSRPVLESERKILAGKGITVFYNNASSDAVIYRLVTSYTDDAIWQEGTTRFIADYVLENNEELLRQNYQRTKNVARVLSAIKTDIKTAMEGYQALEIIENFDASTLTVVKDPSDVYGALVDYEFDVVTPLYTITITQHMKL